MGIVGRNFNFKEEDRFFYHYFTKRTVIILWLKENF